MPRVSEAHLAARRQQILDAARTCFIRNGFHATSMQDVIREAGLSVGAVYRYFTSKNDLIRAIAEDTLGRIVTAVDDLVEQETPLPLLDGLGQILDLVDQETDPENGAFRIAVQVWSEALRDTDLAEMVSAIYTTIRSRSTALAERARAAGELPAGSDPARIAPVLFGLTIGYALQRLLLGDPDRATYLAGVRDLIRLTPDQNGGAQR